MKISRLLFVLFVPLITTAFIQLFYCYFISSHFLKQYPWYVVKRLWAIYKVYFNWLKRNANYKMESRQSSQTGSFVWAVVITSPWTKALQKLTTLTIRVLRICVITIHSMKSDKGRGFIQQNLLQNNIHQQDSLIIRHFH